MKKMLFHPVEVECPNPSTRRFLQEQLGGSQRRAEGRHAVYVPELPH